MQVIEKGEVLAADPQFYKTVREESGQPIELCYQCQKCAAGCPLAEYFDYTPNQIIRMVYFGLRDKVLKSTALWLCSSCETCGVRCPNGIKIYEVMDTLRNISSAENAAGDKEVETFHRIFMDEVKKRGRVHEVTLMAAYKIKTRKLFTDIGLGMDLFKKGKLPLMPESMENKEKIKELFDKAGKAGKGVDRDNG